MIVKALLTFILNILSSLVSLFTIPGAGAEFNRITTFITEMFTNSQSLIGFFIPWNIVRFGLPVVIAIVNFEYIYKFIMWVLRKIPMLNIK